MIKIIHEKKGNILISKMKVEGIKEVYCEKQEIVGSIYSAESLNTGNLLSHLRYHANTKRKYKLTD